MTQSFPYRSFKLTMQFRTLFHRQSLIGNFVEENQLGEVMVGEVGIYTQRDPDTIRAAGILYISHERLSQATPDSFLDFIDILQADG